MVINHLLTGMILQVRPFLSSHAEVSLSPGFPTPGSEDLIRGWVGGVHFPMTDPCKYGIFTYIYHKHIYKSTKCR